MEGVPPGMRDILKMLVRPPSSAVNLFGHLRHPSSCKVSSFSGPSPTHAAPEPESKYYTDLPIYTTINEYSTSQHIRVLITIQCILVPEAIVEDLGMHQSSP